MENPLAIMMEFGSYLGPLPSLLVWYHIWVCVLNVLQERWRSPVTIDSECSNTIMLGSTTSCSCRCPASLLTSYRVDGMYLNIQRLRILSVRHSDFFLAISDMNGIKAIMESQLQRSNNHKRYSGPFNHHWDSFTQRTRSCVCKPLFTTFRLQIGRVQR
jgi:hypothetical protein